MQMNRQRHVARYGAHVSFALAAVTFALAAYFAWSTMEYNHAIDFTGEATRQDGPRTYDGPPEEFWRARRNTELTKAISSAVFGLVCLGLGMSIRRRRSGPSTPPSAAKL